MRRSITYQPALDGVRALAVIAVLLFHAGVPGFSGGYLGVSVFFTLSGYLITTLLLSEHASSGSIDLGAFYARRVRRLLPASAVCLTGVVLLARFTDLFEQVDGLQVHATGSILQVANWVFLAGDGSYQELLAQQSGAVSPLEHFWSLAIEEQFYWVWPPFVALVLAKVHTPRRRFRVIAWSAIAASVAAPLIALGWGPDAAYWATPARIGEILIGAWVAAALADGHTAPDRRWSTVAPIALGVLAVAVATFPASGGPAYHGALPLVALVSAALLIGLQAPGRLCTSLAWSPLVYVGRISYGLYLFHWPIYVVLDEHRLGVGGAGLLATRLSATLAIAVVSFHAIESPIRHARWPQRSTLGAALLTTAAVAVAAVTAVPSGLGTYWQPDAEVAAAVAIEPRAPRPSQIERVDPAAFSSVTAPPDSEPPVTEPPFTEPPAPSPLRLLVIGDSTGEALAAGLSDWAAEHPELLQVTSLARPGCGVEHESVIVGDLGPVAKGCAAVMADDVPAALELLQPDVALVFVTLGDVIPRSWDGGATTMTSDSAEFQLRIVAAYRDELSAMAADHAGTTVVWARPPVPEPAWQGRPHPSFLDGSQAAIDAVVETLPGVTTLDLRAWFEGSVLGADPQARPDGLHLSRPAADEVSAWMVPELVEIARAPR